MPTLLDRLKARGVATGSVLSKSYLFGIFGTRASYRWEPAPVIPVTEHAPDLFTTEALIAMVDGPDPRLVFVNFGDIDRYGHADLTGPLPIQAVRTLALAQTDIHIGRFVDHLKATGKLGLLGARRARRPLDGLVDTDRLRQPPWPILAADPLLAGRFAIAQNGGADLLYWTGPPASRTAGVARMRQLAAAQAGVLTVAVPR